MKLYFHHLRLYLQLMLFCYVELNLYLPILNQATLTFSAEAIEKLITPKTKALVIMHYAGMSCDMEEIIKIGQKHHLFLIEDAVLPVDCFMFTAPPSALPSPSSIR